MNQHHCVWHVALSDSEGSLRLCQRFFAPLRMTWIEFVASTVRFAWQIVRMQLGPTSPTSVANLRLSCS